jgi:hypothetical protein
MLTECARYKELKRGRTARKHKGEDAWRWAQFVSIADEGTEARKRECLAPITKASGFWGVDKVQHYGFANEGWKFCKNLGTTATRNPGWEEFRTKQNQLTLANKGCKDSMNPVSLSNLQIIQVWPHREDHQIKRGAEFVVLKYQPVSTSELPAEHAFDKYGLIVLSKYIDAERSPVEGTACRMAMETVQLGSEETSSFEDADSRSSSLQPRSVIQASGPSASSSPASPTPLQLPETSEVPSNRPTSSENASSTSLSSLPSTRPSTSTHSPVSTDTNESWHTELNILAAPLRKSQRLNSVSKPSYSCIPSKTRTERSNPERLSTRDQIKVRGADEGHCSCSNKISTTFLRAIEGSQQMSGFEDITKYLDDEAQQDLCLNHLRMYASWARVSMLRQRASQSPLLKTPARPVTDLRDNARCFMSLKRRLSLPISSNNSNTLFEEHPSKRWRDMDIHIGRESGSRAKQLHVTDDSTRTPSVGSNVADPRPHSPTINRTATCNTAHQAVSCSDSTPDVLDFDDFRKRYLADTTASIEQSILDVRRTIDEFANLPKQSRLREELPRYYEILKSAIPPKVLSYADFTSLRTLPTNAILLATMEEAALVLMQGPLRIPILVPSRFRQDFIHKTTIGTFLQEHHMGHWIMVQDYAKPIGKGDVRQMQKAEFVEKYFNPRHYPLNCLDLAGTAPNPDPPCYVRIPSLHLLGKVAAGGHGGKMHYMRNNDLAASQSFMLLAKAGAWSMPHIDRSGVLSSVEGIEGKKLWLTWTALTIEELEAYDESAADAPRAYQEAPPSRSNDEAFTKWQQNYASAPRIHPIAPLIDAGDVYLQPSGGLHSPYSFTNVLMHGTMHWDSRDIERIMQLAMLETHHRPVTNEDEPNDFYHLMQRAMYKMREDRSSTASGGFEWPESNGKTKSEELFEVRSYQDGLNHTNVIARNGKHATRAPKIGNRYFEAASAKASA